MTNVTTSGLTAQVVYTGATGSTVRVTDLAAQAVTFTPASATRVDFMTAQAVILGTSGARMRLEDLIAQVVMTDGFGGTGTGGAIRTDSLTSQVVYTTGQPASTRQWAWTYDHDGHTFYALDLGSNGTIVYDLTTGKWSHYETQGMSGHWNMKVGRTWRGLGKTIAGDAQTGVLYIMDMNSFLDDGFRPVVYEVNGILLTTSLENVKNFAIRLGASSGRNADDVAPTLTMNFSDDLGVTWSSDFTMTLTTDSKQRIEFRGLGSFAQPGRIFRFVDTGGVKFIGYCVAETD